LLAAVVPTTREQSATASATLLHSFAFLSRADAPTADRASRKANSMGFTTREFTNPKLHRSRRRTNIERITRGDKDNEEVF